MVFLSGIGLANPSSQFSQAECLHAMQSSTLWNDLHPRSQRLLARVLIEGEGVLTRSLAVDRLEELFQLEADVMQRRYLRWAPKLAEEAIRNALDEAGLGVDRLEAVIVSSHTGHLCPALTTYVSERLGLRAESLVLDLAGQGCGAALPNLEMASSLIASGQASVVASVCVEICSASFSLDDDPGRLISSCLFADGAAAVVLTEDAIRGNRRVEWLVSERFLSTQNRHEVRLDYENGLRKAVLSRSVPELSGKLVKKVFSRTLEQERLNKDDISSWAFHGGGPRVIDALQRSLELTDENLAPTRAVLKAFGNMSSPFVMYVLHDLIAYERRGGFWFISSFGAGFSVHGALVKVEGQDGN